MASPIYQHQELQVHGLDCGAGDACAHACREGGHRILDVMDMMVDITRGCHKTCMSRRWTSGIGLGGHASGHDLGITLCMHAKSVGDGHDGHDGGGY